MQGYFRRKLEEALREDLEDYPIVAILGPRQCGKSTLVKEFGQNLEKFLYLDLENPADIRKLSDPELFFDAHPHHCICLDEIQRLPEIFTVLRSYADKHKRKGQFILLGSASPELLRQSSESLAGRVSYIELTPFHIAELNSTDYSRQRLWLRGGFPDSYLFSTDKKSYHWRENFIKTFLERDIPQLGIKIPSQNIRNLWTMCAHSHGSLVNYNKLGQSLGLSHNTIKSYIELLQNTYMVRLLPPYYTNTKKRLVKSDKIYIRDSGVLHSLLNIADDSALFGHPVLGASWEGFVIENILNSIPGAKGYFYRTSAGAEIDLVLEYKNELIAIECKATKSPTPGRGFWNALEDLGIQKAFIIAPVEDSYPIEKRVTVISAEELLIGKTFRA